MNEIEKANQFIKNNLDKHINHCVQFIQDDDKNNFGQVLRYADPGNLEIDFILFLKISGKPFPINILSNQIIKCLTCESIAEKNK